MQARASAAYLAASSQTASVRVLYPLHWALTSNNLPITDRPFECHDTLRIRCGHIDIPLAAHAWDGRARRTCAALWRVGRRVRGAHWFTDDRTW